MITDIVQPEGDEQHFFKIAKKLGYDNLTLLYPLKKAEKIAPSFSSLCDQARQQDISLALATTQNSKVFALHGISPLIIVAAHEDARSHIQKRATHIVYDLELTGQKEFIHHRNSGLNHVVCNLAKEKGVGIGFSICSLLTADPQYQALILGRMRQNAMFCARYGLKAIVASFAKNPLSMRSPKDLYSFASYLGLKGSFDDLFCSGHV